MSLQVPLMIVHGGAWSIPNEMEQDHIRGTYKAIAQVYPELLSGEIDAEEAVVRAISILENDETFDAGKGSFLNLKGQVEMDASIMNGTTMKCGAVCAIQNVRNPIRIAQRVMNQTEHVLLVGENALEFAKSTCKSEEEHKELFVESVEQLLTTRELEFLESIRNNEEFTSRTVFESKIDSHPPPSKKGTVGCVALDLNGNICAGTSTGGTPKKCKFSRNSIKKFNKLKVPGRSGDTGIVGSGTYADSSVGGASSTGWGESIMKIQMTGTVVKWLEFHNTPTLPKTASIYSHLNFESSSNIQHDAAQKTNMNKEQVAIETIIEYLDQKVNGLGGLIFLSKEGKYAVSHNTDKMSFAFVPHDTINKETGHFEVVSIVSRKKGC
ncbi:hypothetical protein C9374_000377 [Naegleria lovaniensis]|uniref:Asparaginase n=1 Tax=Naegleria lovaniensis TaxID=51637 RepID=A0AA88GCB5_NAELO|nr:uncharacterized protein C9374_000377 [Naegleria lovaniensis]KAG2370579.1 hypothetical protein C9374_000377 [Naegleria lovaniensis]